MAMCRLQREKNRLWLFEHPHAVRPWMTEAAEDILELPGVMFVDFDFCKFGMKSTGMYGEGLVKQMTEVMTNSIKLAKRLAKAQRRNDHRHIPSVNFRAGPCQEYTDEFCDELCGVVKEEICGKQGLVQCSSLTTILTAMHQEDAVSPSSVLSGLSKAYLHPHCELGGYTQLYHGMGFHDDFYGRPLGKEKAIAARKFELYFVKRMEDSLGATIRTTRWIDTNKGDEKKLRYRARLAGREVKANQRPDLFAVTPLLESLHMILSVCSHNQQSELPYMILSRDIKLAYFFAKTNRPLFIEIRLGDNEPGDDNRGGVEGAD